MRELKRRTHPANRHRFMSLISSITPTPLRAPPAVPTDPIWRLSIDQYHEMIRNGILTDDDPVELLEGWLVYKMPKNPSHRAVTRLTRQALEALLPAGWYVDSQEPVTIGDSEPEPDVVVVRGETRDYSDRHPGPQDLGLLVEVADTTLHRDRGSKKRLYAGAAIPCYWIINLLESQIEVYTDPSGPAEAPNYRQRQDFKRGDDMPVSIGGREVGRISVQALLP
jgi:Uma2 family endonuclease